MITRSSRAWLLAAAVWTLFVWGSRIGLLTESEAAEATTWLRVGGSVLFGLALALAAVFGLTGRWLAALAYGFAGWMVVIWVPDVIRLFTEERTRGFVAVHLVLASVSLTLAWQVVRHSSLGSPAWLTRTTMR